MKGPAFSIPAKRVSAWTVETEPDQARAWLATLPLADSAEAGRELYQALYTLNRQELDPARRFALMELYPAAVAEVARQLRAHYAHAALPLSPKRHQLAEFVRQLYVEMAYGYKCCLHDLERSWKPWARRRLRAQAIERAMRYLGEVLLHSYIAYLPWPPDTWREIHALYRYAESLGETHEPVRLGLDESAGVLSIHERYIRLLLLGLSQPYQLPRGECRLVAALIEHHAGKARLTALEPVSSPAGRFVVDLAADGPPTPYPRGEVPLPGEDRRLLDVLALVHTLHGFVRRLQRDEPARVLDLGIECLDAACEDLLRRLMRAWGVPARRRHARLRRRGRVFVCVGLPAVHFFASGQQPFVSRVEEPARPPWPAPAAVDGGGEEAVRAPDHRMVSYRVDRWQVVDVSPSGLLLTRAGERGVPVRVGEIIGIQEVRDPGRWRVGCVRWLRCPQPEGLEMGVELLAPEARPVAVRGRREAVPGLILPALPAMRRPATLIVARHVVPAAAGEDLEIVETQSGRLTRCVRLLRLVERTGSFEQHVVADVVREAHG